MMETFNGWAGTQLTEGTRAGRFHAHAYYDIPVFDADSRLVAGHQVGFAGRQPTPNDAIEIGYVDTEGDRAWTPVGESRAWSWQQGAMTQWVPGSRTLVWNDREGDGFVARTLDLDTGQDRTLPRPVYAVDPTGQFALSLNMARLDHVRPGYGYPGGAGARLDQRRPADDGVWRMDLETGDSRLVLSLRDAARLVAPLLSPKERLKHFIRRYVYWFNHVKMSPDGQRFTVKFRFRPRDFSRWKWNGRMGMSLTCGVDGSDLRLLSWATSHVIWLDDERLYLWNEADRELALYRDAPSGGQRVERMAPGLVDYNVHMRHFPETTDRFVFDTPYREEVDVFAYDASSGEQEQVARFQNHRPTSGAFRCDLHPNPSPDGEKVVVTSLDDGGRQMYLLTR
ncbi:hypothetical protein [Rubrivirga litoralis]|uniref:Uncharacterized protein n=1 Tax=Rubrivirga litoralis TaxID=3075598 RepID=A0ABU3BPI3_9BACT|nr:hypothetical protein [Rubrivirga sp. F394]MDT0631200.1 hypothetical protein [Rubrivirga sp. F394]